MDKSTTQGITNTTQNYKNIYNPVSTNFSKISHKNLLKKTELIRVEAGNEKKKMAQPYLIDTEINFSTIKKDFVKEITQFYINDNLDYTYSKQNVQEHAKVIAEWSVGRTDAQIKDKIYRDLTKVPVIVVDCKSKKEFIKKYVIPMFEMVKEMLDKRYENNNDSD